MGGDVLAAALQVVAQPLHHLERVRDLQVGIETAVQDAVVHRVGVARDVSHQRHDRLFELGEHRLQLLRRHAGLSAVEQRVVGAVLVSDGVGDPTIELDVLFEIRREQAEVLVVARLLPDRPGGGTGACDLRHEVGRKLACLVVVAARDPDEAGFVGVERPAAELVLELAQQPADLVRGEANMGQAEQGRKLLGP